MGFSQLLAARPYASHDAKVGLSEGSIIGLHIININRNAAAIDGDLANVTVIKLAVFALFVITIMLGFPGIASHSQHLHHLLIDGHEQELLPPRFVHQVCMLNDKSRAFLH